MQRRLLILGVLAIGVCLIVLSSLINFPLTLNTVSKPMKEENRLQDATTMPRLHSVKPTLHVSYKMETNAILTPIALSVDSSLHLSDKKGEHRYITSETASKHTVNPAFGVSFREYLKSKAYQGVIYLASVDISYIDMGINLYKTSFQKHGINNYVFACMDSKAHAQLVSLGINSYDYIHDKDSNVASIYNTEAFKRKTHQKTKIVLEGLLEGLNVILVDVDIIFFKRPYQYLKCDDCDIMIQYDAVEPNGGFYLARPTKPAIDLHQESWRIAQTPEGLRRDNQKVVNRKLSEMKKKNQIKVVYLSSKLFPNGLDYFEKNPRMFFSDNPPVDEVICHNNWIKTKEAKIYRFKEHLMWDVDRNGYYSDASRKYMTYSNPPLVNKSSTVIIQLETEALKTALVISHVLNRTLILPTFTCTGCTYNSCRVPTKACSLNSHFNIKKFDEQLDGLYREHVFLHHKLIHKEIKSRVDKNYLIKSVPLDGIPKSIEGIIILESNKNKTVPSLDEILQWFSANQDPVLYFHSLYNLLSAVENHLFYNTVQKAIDLNKGYRQLK